jgi:hypothetical protein
MARIRVMRPLLDVEHPRPFGLVPRAGFLDPEDLPSDLDDPVAVAEVLERPNEDVELERGSRVREVADHGLLAADLPHR